MEEFVRIITHARRLKTLTKDLSIDELTDIKGKLDKIIEDRISADNEAKLKDAEKEQKIAQYREMLAADGITPDELVMDSSVKGKRAPRPAKFKIEDENGKALTWTGQGRMPNIFRAKVDAGESIEKFLIK